MSEQTNISSLAYKRNSLVALLIDGQTEMSKKELGNLQKRIDDLNLKIEKTLREREGKK